MKMVRQPQSLKTVRTGLLSAALLFGLAALFSPAGLKAAPKVQKFHLTLSTQGFFAQSSGFSLRTEFRRNWQFDQLTVGAGPVMAWGFSGSLFSTQVPDNYFKDDRYTDSAEFREAVETTFKGTSFNQLRPGGHVYFRWMGLKNIYPFLKASMNYRFYLEALVDPFSVKAGAEDRRKEAFLQGWTWDISGGAEYQLYDWLWLFGEMGITVGSLNARYSLDSRSENRDVNIDADISENGWVLSSTDTIDKPVDVLKDYEILEFNIHLGVLFRFFPRLK